MSAVCLNDKNKIKRAFSSAAIQYDGWASLQRSIGKQLLSHLVIEEIGCIVDIGCGTGFFTQQVINKMSTKQLIAIDIAFSMLQVSRAKLQAEQSLQFICADAEYLPLAENSVNTIVSNVALQWCQNLIPVFEGFNKSLKASGKLIFSTFGPATLNELKSAWASVDNDRHVNNFYSMDDLSAFLTQTGFENIEIKRQQYLSTYQTVMALMKELKGIGANKVITTDNRRITSKGEMQRMINQYETFRSKGLIPATYEVFFISATTKE